MPRLLARFTAPGHWVATVAVAVAVALGPPAAATYFDISICCFVPCLVVRSAIKEFDVQVVIVRVWEAMG